eukprot:scaffold46886_cov28-Tisochrysis_lutea.AAC.2
MQLRSLWMLNTVLTYPRGVDVSRHARGPRNHISPQPHRAVARPNAATVIAAGLIRLPHAMGLADARARSLRHTARTRIGLLALQCNVRSEPAPSVAAPLARLVPAGRRGCATALRPAASLRAALRARLVTQRDWPFGNRARRQTVGAGACRCQWS